MMKLSYIVSTLVCNWVITIKSKILWYMLVLISISEHLCYRNIYMCVCVCIHCTYIIYISMVEVEIWLLQIYKTKRLGKKSLIRKWLNCSGVFVYQESMQFLKLNK